MHQLAKFEQKGARSFYVYESGLIAREGVAASNYNTNDFYSGAARV